MNPRADQAYIYLIGISMNIGNKSISRRLVDEVLKVNPYSLDVRMEYLTSLLPRWGGSIKAMADFIEESRPYYSANPVLRILEGRIDAERGDQEKTKENYASALTFYNEALRYGDNKYYLWQRGNTYYLLEQYDSAICDYTKIINVNPFDHAAIYMRAKSNIKIKKYNEALVDIERYIDVFYLSARILSLRGSVYYKLKDYSQALKDYQSAYALNPSCENCKKKIKKIQKRLDKKGSSAYGAEKEPD